MTQWIRRSRVSRWRFIIKIIIIMIEVLLSRQSFFKHRAKYITYYWFRWTENTVRERKRKEKKPFLKVNNNSCWCFWNYALRSLIKLNWIKKEKKKREINTFCCAGKDLVTWPRVSLVEKSLCTQLGFSYAPFPPLVFANKSYYAIIFILFRLFYFIFILFFYFTRNSATLYSKVLHL